MASRSSIHDALKRSAKGVAPEPVITPAAAPAAAPIKSQDRSPSQICREGRVNVTGYFPPEVKASIRLVQAKRGGNQQDILAEALNDLFAKYNVPETAPRKQ
jgi:peptidoglycan hydrolase-like protein with peptidoglycan-binding domain